ncbi:MAG TPA: glycerophosphoryl diester phosphodiesterase membrane domain-containing protein [Capillimicrobium sp.]|nr:glycerophosphoryl diester phosphodiesterase membrane domain-containing protein [Capillimicrobium sp.]
MILDRPRGIRELVAEALVLYQRDWLRYVTLAALVIVPADLLVLGLGVGELSASYDAEMPRGDMYVSFALAVVTGALVFPMTIAVLRARLDDAPTTVRAALRAGLDVFAAVLAAAILVVAGLVLGLFAFVVPGLILAVRLAVTVPAVVVEGRRGVEALDRSWRLTRGAFFRTAGALLSIFVPLFVFMAVVVGIPANLLAEEADAYGVMLLGSMVIEVLTTPYFAIGITLLFGDLRARREARDAAAAA